MEDLAYFYVLKHEARERTKEALNVRLLQSGGVERFKRLTLCSIMGEDVGRALDFVEREWPEYYGPDTHSGFPESWSKLVRRYSHRKDHFDLAIWQEVDGRQVLAALAIGNPSHARTHLSVKWIERFFGHSHISGRVLWPILTCAEEYAKLLGCERVLIKDPVDSKKYERYGYGRYRHPEIAHGGNYLCKEMQNG